MDDQTSPPSDTLLGAALESVTGDFARRFTVRIDRLLSQISDLTDLEQQLAELQADLAVEPSSDA